MDIIIWHKCLYYNFFLITILLEQFAAQISLIPNSSVGKKYHSWWIALGETQETLILWLVKVTGCCPPFFLVSLSLFYSPWSLVRSLEIWWYPKDTVSCQEDRERAALVVTDRIILLGSVMPHQSGHDHHRSCQRARFWVVRLATEQGCLCSCSQPDPCLPFVNSESE